MNMSSMSSDYSPVKATHLHYIGEEPPKNPRRRRHQGTLILPCLGHVRPAGQSPCNVAIITNTTLGNRYLGSRIDEECSKMRYHGVNCIIPQTIEFLNASCTRGLLVEGTSAWASRQKTLPTHHCARTWCLAPHALWYGGLQLGLPAYRVEHLHVVGDISCSRCSVSARN